MAKKVSMKDIAAEVGVSVALVSYVLNGKFTNRIKAETAEKIKHLAKKYDYQPNQIAKSLKSNKTFTIGLIVADISNLFYSSIARHIEDEANRLGYNVVFGSAYEDPNRFKALLDVFIAKRVDGLILAVPEDGEKYLEKVLSSNIPYVVLDREFDVVDPSKIVNIDNYQASSDAVKHLYSNNFNRIGAIGLKTSLKHLLERKRGFLETSKEFYSTGFTFMYEVEESELYDEIEKLVLHAIHVDQVDCLYFFTNKIAMAALGVLAKYNVEIPQKIGVLCFDEAEAYHLFKTPISFIRQPLKLMSQLAVNLILGNHSQKKGHKFHVEIVENASTLLRIT